MPETDWGTDLLLQRWVGPKHAGRDTPTPQPWNTSQPPAQLGAPSWLIIPPNLSGHWHVLSTHSPFNKESRDPDTQWNRSVQQSHCGWPVTVDPLQLLCLRFPVLLRATRRVFLSSLSSNLPSLSLLGEISRRGLGYHTTQYDSIDAILP